MPYTDLHSAYLYKRGIQPTRQTNSDAAINGDVIDVQGFESAELIVQVGALTDANATVAVTIETDDAVGFASPAALPAANLIGSLPTFAAATEDGFIKKVGVKIASMPGSERFMRCVATPSGNDTGNVDISALWVLSRPAKQPVTQSNF